MFSQLRTFVPEGYYLIADTAFPHGAASINGKIQAPLKGGDRIAGDEGSLRETLAFNAQLLAFRQTAEWGMRTLQGSFGRLRIPLDINNPDGRQQLLEVCVRLFNLRARLVGINQIRSVYLPIWQESEDERLWTALGDMAFGDIRRHDRVACFHLVFQPDNGP